jgi:hypothetical protein
MSEFDLAEVNSFVDEAIDRCRRRLEADDPWSARLAVTSAANYCRSLLRESRMDLTDDDKSSVLLLGILCAAHRDFADCFDLLKKPFLRFNEVELLWTRLIDCLERMDVVRGAIEGTGVDWLAAQVSGAYDHVLQQFGPGLYCSPEIVVDRELCSICGKDYRACGHRAGVIYDGKRCRKLADGMELRSSSIVKIPVDRRCRIWPWNFDKETNRFSAKLLTTFDVDDLTDPCGRTRGTSETNAGTA